MHADRKQPKHLVAFILACISLLLPLLAQADPPGRVGRITLIEGAVKFYADQEESWQAARLNLPVTSENSVWTESGARAEFRVGATAIRLDASAVLDVQKLDDTNTLLYLQRGSANIRIGLLEKQDVYRIQTPDGAVNLRARGSYRVEVDVEKGETRIAVLSGRARLDLAGGAPWLEAGRMALIERGAVRLEPLARTEFDDWAEARDERLDPTSVAHVSPHMTGYEELTTWGSWSEEGEYGSVWYPRDVAEDWAPYRYGHWRHVRPWGWTWIDDAPWGFAPSHYGRWVHVRGRWAWWPGNRSYRPIWSPALVAWVGGSGWNVSFSGGHGSGIGWFPLAPYEAYVPWYSYSPTYIHNINHIHVNRPVPTRPPREYRNHKPGVTVVSPATFQASAPVWRNQGRISGETAWGQPMQPGTILPPHRGRGGGSIQGGPPTSARDTATPGVSGAIPKPLVEVQTVPRPNKPLATPMPQPLGKDPVTTAVPDSMPSRIGPANVNPGGSPAPNANIRSAPQPRYQRDNTRDGTRDNTRESASPGGLPSGSKPLATGEPVPNFRTPAPMVRETRPPQRDQPFNREQRMQPREASPAALMPRPERVERIERPRPAEAPAAQVAPASRPQPAAAPPKDKPEPVQVDRGRQPPAAAER